MALETLEFGDFQERWEILKQFPPLGNTAIAPLIDLLESEDADAELCWFIARILGQFDRPEATEALIDLLVTTQDEDVKAMAASTLANLGQEAIEPLCRLLAEPQWRPMAVEALAQIQHPATIDPLLELVGDPQAAIRATALSALLQFRDRRIPPILVEALEDLSAAVRREATTGLGLRFDWFDPLEVVELLKPRLHDFDLSVCQQAAIALSRCGSDAAALALFQLLPNPLTPLPLQIEIVRGLSWMETPLAMEYLQQTLELKSVDVSLEAVRGLGQISDAGLKSIAAKILIDWLRSGDPTLEEARIRQAVALELGHLGDRQALSALQQLQTDPDEGVRLHAIAAGEKLSAAMGKSKVKSAKCGEPARSWGLPK